MDQGSLIRLALFGKPIKTSLSPKIHRLFAEQFDLQIDYQRIETGTDGFITALQAFYDAGGHGCNVTLPLKREAWRLASELTDEVRQAQAANTLLRRPAGGWSAYNTDGAGLVVDLTNNHGIALRAKRVLVLGAGGAVAGILSNLCAAKVSQIVLVNRNLERAKALAARYATMGDISVVDWQDLAGSGSFGLVINATSLGHQGVVPPLIDSVLEPGSYLYDLNYFKAGLPLKTWCDERGQTYIDGLGMLVEQAAESFSIWTGQQPQTSAVIKACEETLV